MGRRDHAGCAARPAAPGALLAISRDVTEQRRTVERVRWAAGHDAMTGLRTGGSFMSSSRRRSSEARATGRRVGLLVLDIDHFKEVNDDRGHDAGDAAAARLFGAAAAGGAVQSRHGRAARRRRVRGHPQPSRRHRTTWPRSSPPILERLQIPFNHLGRSLDCRASVGAALYPDQGESPDELMKNADLALYAAKLSHRGSVTMFSPEMRAEMQNRISMLNLARDAIRHGLIDPYYQPKVNFGPASSPNSRRCCAGGTRASACRRRPRSPRPSAT